jgi:ribosome-associated heat shock protein Hsp15
MDRHRLDLWLKLVCLYKHRAEATEACRGGHVKLNGTRAKPSSAIREGDVIEIVDEGVRRVIVLGLPERTVSKELARTMYRDESPPQQRRAAPDVGRRDRGTGRPTRKDRRDLSKAGRRERDS